MTENAGGAPAFCSIVVINLESTGSKVISIWNKLILNLVGELSDHQLVGELSIML